MEPGIRAGGICAGVAAELLTDGAVGEDADHKPGGNPVSEVGAACIEYDTWLLLALLQPPPAVCDIAVELTGTAVPSHSDTPVLSQLAMPLAPRLPLERPPGRPPAGLVLSGAQDPGEELPPRPPMPHTPGATGGGGGGAPGVTVAGGPDGPDCLD
mmetsp:Transcript_96371/g.170371  ORF Transcript_96371/g.170371 Transcript_96371/m.170371 type:complete len:156 (-) Transcript_96371:413-880(-)